LAIRSPTPIPGFIIFPKICDRLAILTAIICMVLLFENQIPFLTKRLHQVRKERRCLSIRCVLRFPVITITTRFYIGF
jgi:hypothetical protein